MRPASSRRPVTGPCGALSAVVLLTGCTQFVADGEQARQGWREARVVQIGTGASIDRPATRDCRKEVAPEAAATGRYAAYQYRSAGGRFYVIAPLPDTLTFKVGDPVRVNTKSCSPVPTPRRATRPHP